MEINQVLPARAESYERTFYESGVQNFFLNLRQVASGSELVQSSPRRARHRCDLRPETELASHYFQAILPKQFDEYVWFDSSKAIMPFETKTLEEIPDTYPLVCDRA